MTMTAHQEAYQLISKMPDESVKHLVGLLKSMTPDFLSARKGEDDVRSQASKRLGAGKGVIVDTPNFDAWDGEVAALFEGSTL